MGVRGPDSGAEEVIGSAGASRARLEGKQAGVCTALTRESPQRQRGSHLVRAVLPGPRSLAATAAKAAAASEESPPKTTVKAATGEGMVAAQVV